MGLSKDSMGINAVDMGFIIKKVYDTDRVIALAGNPNVGKSTVFNGLTGLRQHTGNWPGKTVSNAQGYCTYKQNGFVIVDLPGCYSLMAHSAEEEVARDFICSGEVDAVVVVCDATCLERNLNLVLQTIELTDNVIVCINLIDEAQKKGIEIDIKTISRKLGVQVIETCARDKRGLEKLMQIINQVTELTEKQSPIKVKYPDYIEESVADIEPYVRSHCKGSINPRYLSLMLINWDESIHGFINRNLGSDILLNGDIADALKKIKYKFECMGITKRQITDDIVSALIYTAEEVCKDTITFENKKYRNEDLKIDSILMGKWTAFPIMLLALLGIFWLTITGANYPSELIGGLLFWLEERLLEFFIWSGMPKLLYEILILGVYRVLAWVISVMLPPMAIFFPLFTLLEDIGVLPRIAFNLDKCFKKCCACGKQALTMCMVAYRMP